VTDGEAERLLGVARELRWTFPSSSGFPVRRDDAVAKERAGERAAFADAARSFAEAGREDLALEVAAHVWRLWIMARDIAGGRAFLATVLDAPAGPSRFRARTLYGDGLFAFWKGALRESRARNEAALADATATGDSEALALASLGLSRVALSEGQAEEALTHASRALALARPLGEAMTQAPLHMSAQAHRAAERFDTAASLFAESLALNRRLGDEGMVVVELHNLGHAEIRRGRVDAAERAFSECAKLGGTDDPYGVAMNELNAAVVAFGRGDVKRARSLLASAESRLSKDGIDPAGDDQTEIRWLRAELARGGDGSADSR